MGVQCELFSVGHSVELGLGSTVEGVVLRSQTSALRRYVYRTSIVALIPGYAYRISCDCYSLVTY